jgi:hypothetical protein
MVFFEAFLGRELLLVGNVFWDLACVSKFALFRLSIVIRVLEFDPFEQVNSHVPSYSSSNAKGALGERFRQHSHVVIGSFYELARFHRYPQRSSISLEVKTTRSLAWTTDEIMH